MVLRGAILHRTRVPTHPWRVETGTMPALMRGLQVSALMRSDRSALIRLGAWVVLVLSALFFLTTGGTDPGIASVDVQVISELSAVPAAADALQAGLRGTYPWATYLRPTVPDLPAPQLTQIGLR